MSTVDERLQQVSRALLKRKPAIMHAGEPGARLLIALHAGEPIVARKSFASGSGHDYTPGELIFNIDEWPESRLASMAEHGYMCSEKEWSESQDFNARFAYYSNEIETRSAMLAQARREASGAAQEMADAQARLMLAKQKAEKAGESVRYFEQELIQALDAPVVLELVNSSSVV